MPERLTSLTPSTVDPTAVKSFVFSKHSPVEIAGAMKGLTDIQFKLIACMYLDSGEIGSLEDLISEQMERRVRPSRGMYQHRQSVVHSELKDVMWLNICESCHGQGFSMEGNKIISCSHCKQTGKAYPSLKLKIKWYSEKRQYLISKLYPDKKINLQRIKDDYVKSYRDAAHVYSWVVNEHNKAITKISDNLL